MVVVMGDIILCGECVLMITCRLLVYSSECDDDDMTDYFAPCICARDDNPLRLVHSFIGRGHYKS